MTKYSIFKLNDTYTVYSEGVRNRYEGYDLDKDELIVNRSDKEIDLEALTYWLLSKDL